MKDLKYNIRPLQEEALKIFKVFAAICEKHGLKYYAAYGTALGAIRHKGFIPWDDDFDVAMPRIDYNKFVKVVQGELPPYMKFSRGGEKPCSPIYFSKILNMADGLVDSLSKVTQMEIEDPPFIDIFVLDDIPQNVLDFQKWWRKRRVWRLCQLWRYPQSSFCSSQKGLKLFLARMLGLCLNWRYRKTDSNEDMMCVLDEILEECPISEHVVEVAFFRMKETRLLPRSFFEPVRIVPFEDTQIHVAGNVEEILRRYYGDYMKLPPEKDRVPPHVLRYNYEGHV